VASIVPRVHRPGGGQSMRFGTPSWVRSYTTAGNYYVGLLAYLLFICFTYFLLAEVIKRAALEAIKKGLMPSWLAPWIVLALF